MINVNKHAVKFYLEEVAYFADDIVDMGFDIDEIYGEQEQPLIKGVISPECCSAFYMELLLNLINSWKENGLFNIFISTHGDHDGGFEYKTVLRDLGDHIQIDHYQVVTMDEGCLTEICNATPIHDDTIDNIIDEVMLELFEF